MKNFLLFAIACLAISLTSCKEEPAKPTLSQTSYTLKAHSTTPLAGQNLEGTVWDSANEYVASVTNGITIESMCVGKTTVRSNNNLSFTVEVKPQYNTYTEPITNWGNTVGSLKAKYGDPITETSSIIMFKTGNTKAPIVLFQLEGGVVTGSGVASPVSAYGEILNFLTERYVPVEMDSANYSVMFAACSGKRSNPNLKMAIQTSYSSSLMAVLTIYVQNNNTDTKSLSPLPSMKHQSLDVIRDFGEAIKSSNIKF